MRINLRQIYDIVIIGGGFYGCMIGLTLSKLSKKVLIIEKEDQILKRASYNNQARVHNGYHYPRSFLTAVRSHVNFLKFSKDYKEAICDNYSMIYAIANALSKTTSLQFVKFCQHLGSNIYPASDNIKKMFNPYLLEDIYIVEEYIFNAAILRELVNKLLHKARVKILYNSEVNKITKTEDKIIVHLSIGNTITTEEVFNCAYSQINTILVNSNLPPLPLKHELTEMPLIDVPDRFKKIGITIMDGPFFGVLPFPDKNLHTFHHVRYTPRISWTKSAVNKQKEVKKATNQSNYIFMKKDVERFIPSMKDATYKDSLYEVRTILTQMEASDGRPILLKDNYGFEKFHVVLGGKIDNVYDVIKGIKRNF